MKKIIFAFFVLALFIAGCKAAVTNFDECAAAGYPVMESYPRQCSDGKNTFIEIIEEPVVTMTKEEAMRIAENSECAVKGDLTDTAEYNDYTKTWWIDLTMRPEFENELCNPACVVWAENGKAEINWRCTGAIPPEGKE